MDKHNRIYWKIGLDITPETFIKADNYHIAERCMLMQSYAFRAYGILPDTNFKISNRINHDIVFIDELYCRAITRNGHLIDVQNDITFKELNLRDLSRDKPSFVILNVDSFQPKAIGKEALYAQASYTLEITDIPENFGTGIPIMKILYDRRKRSMEVENNYIVPPVCLSASRALVTKHKDICNIIGIIIDKLPPVDPIFIHVELLYIELKNYSFQEFPGEMILLLKKFCTLLKSYLKRLNRDDFDEMQVFLNDIYNHNDILCIIQKGVACLKTINQKIDEKPVEVEVVKEVPEPEPEPPLPVI